MEGVARKRRLPRIRNLTADWLYVTDTDKEENKTLLGSNQRRAPDDSLEWAKRMLNRCTCIEADNLSGTPHAPRRLLNVGRVDQEVRLVENMFYRVRYCALSYCWGSAGNNLRTTRANLDLHLQHVDPSLLPQVSRST